MLAGTVAAVAWHNVVFDLWISFNPRLDCFLVIPVNSVGKLVDI